MTDSTNKTDELDRYGVWVKKPPRNIKSDNENEPIDNNDDAFTISADLPDFSSLDEIPDLDEISDDKTEEVPFPAADSNTTVNEEQSTFDIPTFDDINFDDIKTPNQDSQQTNAASADELPNVEEPTKDAEQIDIPADGSAHEEEEISLDDFLSDGVSNKKNDPDTRGPEDKTESGKTETTADDSSESENIALDEFIETEPSSSKEEEIDIMEEEKPLDIDLDFSEEEKESQDQTDIDLQQHNEVPSDTGTETVDMTEFGLDDIVEPEKTEEKNSPDNLNEMFDTISDTDAKTKANELNSTEPEDKESKISELNTEDVNLSDFGIDEDSDELPIEQPSISPEQTKQQVDYDLTVSADDENTSRAPTAETLETKTSSIPDTFDEETASLTSEDKPATGSQVLSKEGKAILDQIVNELSSLKSDIQNLKNDLADLKNRKAEPTESQQGKNEKESPTGFFSNSGEDDTIALSGEEIKNILNNADFTNEDESHHEADADHANSEETPVTTGPEEATETKTADEEKSDKSETDSSDNSTVIEPNDMFGNPDSVEIPDQIENEVPQTDDFKVDFNTDNLEEPELEDMDFGLDIGDNSTEQQKADVPDEISIPKVDDILVDSSSSDLMDTDDFNETTGATDSQVDNETEPEIESVPDIEEPADTSNDETVQEETPEVPEDTEESETAIQPKPEVLSGTEELGEETDTQPVQETTEEPEVESAPGIEEPADTSNDQAVQEEPPEVPEELGEKTDTQPVQETTEEPEVESVPGIEEPADTSNDETVQEEIPEVPEDTETTVQPKQDKRESEAIPDEQNMGYSLTEDNINYLSADKNTETKERGAPLSESADGTTEPGADAIPGNLKQDIKSVLSYMDQLLENLPEDKITEFAQSEQFSTYKKLFKELGLS